MYRFFHFVPSFECFFAWFWAYEEERESEGQQHTATEDADNSEKWV